MGRFETKPIATASIGFAIGFAFCFGIMTDRIIQQAPGRIANAQQMSVQTAQITPVNQPASPQPAAPPGTADEPQVTLASHVERPAATHHDNMMSLSRLSLTAKADLNEVTFTYHITPAAGNADVGLQIFSHRDDIKTESKWEGIFPVDSNGKSVVIGLYEGIDNTGTFTVTLPKGTYGDTRLILFNSPDGKNVNLGKVVYDTKNDPHAHLNLRLTVASASKRVTSPIMDISPETDTADQGDGTYSATFTGVVKVPQNSHPQDNGFFVMAKGQAGFAQGWAAMKDAVPGEDPLDPYVKVPFKLTVKSIKPGLWNMQFGLFKASWGDALQWIYPGSDFAVGDWIRKAPADRIPPRVRVRNNRFETLDGRPYDFYAARPSARQAVSFVRGGSYGNAIGWTINPDYNRPGYFVLLRGMGCRFMRVVFNPARYETEAVYRDAVDQVVQNIWSAGLYPVIGPQGLVKAPTLQEQVARSLKVVQLMATRYKGKSVWLELSNEPFEVSDWSNWKPIAVRMVRAARAIDPDAFVIVPFEGWDKDARAAAKDPIREVPVDLYDAHAYVKPEEVARNYGDFVKAGLPLYVGEYGGNSADYISRMDEALQNLRGILAIGPWAFTKSGQDSLPLIADGSTAVLHYTPSGQQVASDFALWDQGKRKQ